MTTKRDLELEYKMDTGYDANGSDEFMEWVLEKYISLRDTKMEIEN